MTENQSYELNEKDIDSVTRYLKIYDPESSTPEKAIAKIEEAMASAHALGHSNPEALERLLEALKKKDS